MQRPYSDTEDKWLFEPFLTFVILYFAPAILVVILAMAMLS